MSDRLREISERLRSIEASLSQVHLSSQSHSHGHHEHSPNSMPSMHHSISSPDSTTSSYAADDQPGSGANLASAVQAQHALQTISDTLGLMEAMDKGNKAESEGAGGDTTNGSAPASGGGGSTYQTASTMPPRDAIERGILSVAECEANFKIFFRLLAPWVMFFDRERDGNIVEMRTRSPLLFHVILLSTSYYLMGSSERGTAIYHALVDLVNELIAPVLISTQGYHLNTDLVRALSLLMLYKPVQFASLAAAGITDRAQAEQLSKLNGFTSATLYSVTHRVAIVTQLNLAPQTFTKIFSPGTRAPPQILSDLRLFLFLCVIDGHGALVAGRGLAIDMTEALRCSRMLAALKAQPGDVRLAATVELYGIARGIISSSWFRSCGAAPVPAYELRKFNRELDDWEVYWRPELLLAAEHGDIFAMTVIDTFSNLVRLIINAAVFTRWRHERKLSLSRGGDGRPKLTPDDWSFIQQVLNGAERLMFALSVESRVNPAVATDRRVQWPKVVKGERRAPLTVDQAIVDTHRTAVDPVSTISYIYPCILVTKMANAGLIRCELDICQTTYESGESSNTPQQLIHGAKLPRLLELGAAFLSSFAPTPTHPAHKHARMLRTILAAGTLGQVKRSSASSSSEPGGEAREYQGQEEADLPQLQSSLASSATGAEQSRSLQLPPLPVLPQQQSSSSSSSHQEAAPNNPGLALASILSGIQPAYFGNDATPSFNTMTSGNPFLPSSSSSDGGGMVFDPNDSDLGGTLSAMDVEVDWEGLERSMREAEEITALVGGGGGGGQGMAGGGRVGGEWQGYFALTG